MQVTSSEFDEKIFSEWSDVHFEYGTPQILTIVTRPGLPNSNGIIIDVGGVNFCASENCCQASA